MVFGLGRLEDWVRIRLRRRVPARSTHARLLDALDVIPEGVVLFDAEDRYVLWNRRYAEIYAETRHTIAVGSRFEDTLRAGLGLGQYPDAEGREQEWLAERLATHAMPQSSHVQRLPNGRWVRIEERRTADGGSIGIRIDITEVKRREASFRLLLESNPVPMWIIDRETLRFLAVNKAAAEHYGYSPECFLKISLLDVVAREHWEHVRDAAVTGAPDLAGQTRRHVKADGTAIDVAVYTRSLDFNGCPASVVAVFDLTERKRAETELQNTREFLNMIVEHVPVGIIVKEPIERRYVLVNRAAEEFWGISRDKMLGKRAKDIFPEATVDMMVASDQQLLNSRQPQFVDCVPVDTTGRGTRLARIRRHMVLDREAKPQFLLSVIEDVTEQKRTEAQIAHMARHDSLTDLPNRAAFDDNFAAALERAKIAGECFALFCIDLDRFKDVNDVFGHRIGDALLRELSGRLREAAGTAFLARFGGDEFNLITTETPLQSASEKLAARLEAAVAQDIEIEGIPLRVGLSIGVAMFPANGSDPKTLLANADAALYRAKREGHGAVRFFDAEMDQQLHDKRVLQQELQSAIDRNEFTLHYQPQARIDGEIFGFEALARWNHPARGLVPPSVFIPLAEECGLIGALSDWTVRQACREAASWARPLQIAVNISPNQFRHGDLGGLVHSALLQTGLAPGRLELEITEGVLIDDFSRAVSILRRIKSLGVQIALDDFGTGYSSLSYLQSFPFDKMKIDKSFVSDLKNPQSAAIVRAVIGLGRALRVPVLAEGVETREQLAYLAQEGCDEVQGFLLGRPLPIANYDGVIGRPGDTSRGMRLAG
jgi:diguanylate cyclase (GGDEF)-like protein/PAS domain S-box-containing protein